MALSGKSVDYQLNLSSVAAIAKTRAEGCAEGEAAGAEARATAAAKNRNEEARAAAARRKDKK